MGDKGCLHIIESKTNNLIHNDRTVSPSYLLQENSLGVEVNRSSKEAEELFNELFEEASTNYIKRTHQKIQAQNIKWSGVLLIKETTTMQDIERLVDILYKKFGWQCYQIAIHRDEGHVDILTKETVYNLHAHLEFFMLNKKGIYCYKKREFGKKVMSQIQTLVANELGMERGEDARITKKKHLDHYQQRQQAKLLEKKELKRHELQSELAKVQQEKLELANYNSDLKQCLDEIKKQFLIFKGDTKDTKLSNKVLLERVSFILQRYQQAKVDRDNYKKLLDTATSEKEQLNKQHQDYSKRVNDFLAQCALKLELQNYDFTAILKQLDTKLTELSERNLNYRRTKKELEKSIADITKELYTKADYQAVVNDNLKLKQDNQKLNNRIAALTAQIPTAEQKQELINQGIQAKLNAKELYSKADYQAVINDNSKLKQNNLNLEGKLTELKNQKPTIVEKEHVLTQAEIKQNVESARQQLIKEGWHSKEDYNKLSAFRKEALTRLTKKSDVAPITDSEFFTRLDKLMLDLSQKPKVVTEKQELSDNEIELLPKVQSLKKQISQLYTKDQVEAFIQKATANSVALDKYDDLVNKYNNLLDSYEQEQRDNDELCFNVIDLLKAVTGENIDDNISNEKLNQLVSNTIEDLIEMEDQGKENLFVKSSTRHNR